MEEFTVTETLPSIREEQVVDISKLTETDSHLADQQYLDTARSDAHTLNRQNNQNTYRQEDESTANGVVYRIKPHPNGKDVLITGVNTKNLEHREYTVLQHTRESAAPGAKSIIPCFAAYDLIANGTAQWQIDEGVKA